MAAATSLAPLAWAQSGQPIRILVGFPPGGGSDAIARLLADKLKDELGMTVVVENRPGAGGQIAAQMLKAAPADGHTLFLTHDHTISILPQVVKKPGFDSHEDFVPVAGIATFVNALAVSSRERLKVLPNVPTLDEAGVKGFESYNWLGMIAPASAPDAVVAKLNAAVNAALKRDDLKHMIEGSGGVMVGGTPEAYGQFMNAERAKWAPVIKAAHITLD